MGEKMSDQLQLLDKSREQLDRAFEQADEVIMRKYMTEIVNYSIKDAHFELEKININSMLRLNKVEKIVYDLEENNLDKLMNVYQSVALCGGAIVHIICSDGEKVECYIGTRTENMNEIATCQSALVGTFEGNFPGSKMICQEKKALNACIDKIFSSGIGEQSRIISVVSGIPGIRREESKEFVQGMEKLIDSMGKKKYALVTIAEPVHRDDMIAIKENYEMLYSELSPFSKVVQSYSETDSSSIAENISEAVTKTLGKTTSHSQSESESNATGSSSTNGSSILFKSKSRGTTSSVSMQKGISSSFTDSETNGVSRTTGSTDTYTTTTGKTMQLSYENKRVVDLLKQISKQIERIEDAKDTGLWHTATYCLADDVQTSKTLASTMQSLCRGKKNTVENYSISTWTDPYKLKHLEGYLKKFVHPCFEMKGKDSVLEITPASMISGNELVISAGLPQKGVNGIPISKMVSFARNVVVEGVEEDKDQIDIGNVYHMGNIEKTKVSLNLESLSAHVLITGSTGSGKSNTVYTFLQELIKKEKKFLIIEPAKGEYKNVFGNNPEVHVFGTNSKWSELLKINPFSFPEEIHVLEHIDRLVEIFNVCWPMYAAMPAVLKDAILQAYKKCGWNLETSENIYGENYYPTCMDLQKQIVKVIHSSAYSDEVKGNYIGSLATRINSLTNGINGQMFVHDEIDTRILFDENTIIDLSRIGSQETKSLIMGIIVMKLSEYRMAQANGKMNQPLRHVTILEEAHNLLRNTKNQVSSGEESSMAGKSVEMLSNSIAEMRTYGEGFIIVDQSPSAIDIAAIRNTNTKILMRLPEESDRQQAGKSAAMNEKQIPELAKLPKGVAVVYQNNWLDPVLCKIQKSTIEEAEYCYNKKMLVNTIDEKEARKMIIMLLVGERVDENLNILLDKIQKHIGELKISTESRIAIEQVITSLEQGKIPSLFMDEAFGALSKIVCEVLNYEAFKYSIDSIENEQVLQMRINEILIENIGLVSNELELAIAQCIVRNLVSDDESKIDLYERWRVFAVEKRKLVR